MLSWRSALAARTARLVCAGIGERIARQDHDVFAARAYVPSGHKLLLVLGALSRAPRELAEQVQSGFTRASLTDIVRFPQDVLPV